MADWESVLEDLMGSRHRDLLAYAHMLTGSRADAEDLVQDALIATFGRTRSFPNAVAAETYVRKAIASKFIDGQRRRAVDWRARRTIGGQDIDPAAGPATLVEHATDVKLALAELAPRERACVVLRYLEHQSVAETAATLGLSEGSVKRYVSDGIGKMNAFLGTEQDPDAAEWAPVEGRARA